LRIPIDEYASVGSGLAPALVSALAGALILVVIISLLRKLAN
jgi:hypothetical protein